MCQIYINFKVNLDPLSMYDDTKTSDMFLATWQVMGKIGTILQENYIFKSYLMAER